MLRDFILAITAAEAHLNILMNDVIVSVPGGLFSRGCNLEEGKKYGKIALTKSVMTDNWFGRCREPRLSLVRE